MPRPRTTSVPDSPPRESGSTPHVLLLALALAAAARAAVLAVPAVSEAMVARAFDAVRGDWFGATMLGPLSSTPFKVYAILAFNAGGATLGDKFRPCPLMEQYVAAGRLGRKSGRGVYDYAIVESTVAS